MNDAIGVPNFKKELFTCVTFRLIWQSRLYQSVNAILAERKKSIFDVL